MIAAGVEACRDAAVEAIVVLGHAECYPRFGFTAEAAAGLETPFPPGPHLMAMALKAGSLEKGGTVSYASAFGL